MEGLIVYLGIGLVVSLYSVTAMMVALEMKNACRELFIAFYR